MTNFNSNFENIISRSGLYRVWVPLRNDDKAPLISVWIDPKMTAFEPQTHQESAAISAFAEEETADEIDGSPCCIAIASSGPQGRWRVAHPSQSDC